MAGRIIVGINGSQADDNAVAWAARYAAREGGSLLIFSVIDPSPRGANVDEVEKWANDLLANHAKAAREIAPSVELRTEVQRSHSLPESFEFISESADLLVIGSDTDGTGKGSRNPGSVRIAAVSKAPVVAVPQVDVTERRGVVVGTDGSEVSTKALEFAAAEAQASGEPLIAVISWQSDVAYGYGYAYAFAYVDDFQKAMQESCADELNTALKGVEENYPDLEIHKIIVEGRPADALADQAKKGRLLVVGSHGRGAFRRLLLGSVSHELLQEISLPTAIVR
ncbi:universal stress protein [Gulosibacter chungangensis]|uniref:Universal stress protein n=1 Tax=Gulosibacter chungangensis TaxID=979746 RepID=A0A7J5BEY2_9MICO|nr:universal stress protein [Gulosibacter chungangensis]KAB1644817.1 universal stress protein [Gulosibacter chungangensis]